MLTFTPDGRFLLVANEGEPSDDYLVDPEGSVSIVDLGAGLPGTVRTAGFSAFAGTLLSPAVRVFGPRASFAQDLEPEYITVSDDGRRAWVTLQDNNAIAEIDVERGVTIAIRGLGFKDHLLVGNGLDASDRDGPSINILTWPVRGLYQPDAIASYRVGGQTYLITANEGDARDYDGFSEEARVGALRLDPVAFPNAAALQSSAQLGRLTVTTANGDPDRDGDFDELYSFQRPFLLDLDRRDRSRLRQRRQARADHERSRAVQLRPRLEQLVRHAQRQQGPRARGRRDRDHRRANLGVHRARANRRHRRLRRDRPARAADHPVSQQPELRRQHRCGHGRRPRAGGDPLHPGRGEPDGGPLPVVANEVSGTTTIYRIDVKPGERDGDERRRRGGDPD